MIDIESVVTQVLQKNYPSNWRIYHGKYHQGCLYFWKPERTTTLVILPQGVIQWDNDNEEIVWGFQFSNIQNIQLSGETQIVGYDGDVFSRTYYWLDIYTDNGSYLKWPFGTVFRDAASIGKSIIAAYNHYWY